MKKIYLFPIILLFASLLFLAGCTRYQTRIPALPLRGADLYPREQNKNGLIVAADDYYDEDKSMKSFGVNFAEKNILVLEIIISNKSDDSYEIKSNEVLLLKGNQIIYPLMAAEVSSDEQIREYLNVVEFKDMVINPGETGHGLIYFRLPEIPEEKKEHSFFSSFWPQYDYKLRLGATQLGGDSRLIYTIYLRNL
jgi:hypothetical protein